MRKTALVTGGSSGIGFEKQGFHVVITGRSAERLQKAIDSINEQVPEAIIEYMVCNQASLDNVEAFVKAFKQKRLPIHILINNAGGLFSEESASAEGLEIHYAVNYLAHVYLTLLLMDILEANHARIVNVSSQAHYFAVTTDWNKIKPDAYPKWILYGQSKLANILFTKALSKKYRSKGITVYSVHPGVTKTAGLPSYNDFIRKVLWKTLMSICSTDVQVGVQSTLYAATEPSLEETDYSGTLIGPVFLFLGNHASQHHARLNILHPLFVSDKNAEALWNFTMQQLKDLGRL